MRETGRAGFAAFLCAAALLATSAARAVPVEVPVSDALPHAQIQVADLGTTLCATWLDAPCDLPAGDDYRLIRYDAEWRQRDARRFVVGDAGTPDDGSPVPYVLPSGPGVAQAKLSGPYPALDVVCDSLVGEICEVVPGEYQLQTFDTDWQVSFETVTVTGEAPPLPSPRFYIDLASCDDDATSCSAYCEAGDQAIGGSCAASVDGVAVPLLTDSTTFDDGFVHVCATDQPATIRAEVSCLAR